MVGARSSSRQLSSDAKRDRLREDDIHRAYFRSGMDVDRNGALQVRDGWIERDRENLVRDDVGSQPLLLLRQKLARAEVIRPGGIH